MSELRDHGFRKYSDDFPGLRNFCNHIRAILYLHENTECSDAVQDTALYLVEGNEFEL
jgi:hypothetical protein